MRGFSKRGSGLRITASVLAIVVFDQAALANCDPNPPRASTITICQGTDDGPLIVDTDKADVVVQQGAIVSDVRIKITSSSGPQYGVQTNRIDIAGGGTVSGSVGIDVIAPLSQRRVEATISNAGTITGISGIAVRASGDGSSRIALLWNASTGVIGAIRGQVGTMLNEGLIDGGSVAAYSNARDYQLYYGQGAIDNRGAISSASASDATIDLFDLYSAYPQVTNSGTIENLGTGSAIRGNNRLFIINETEGTIRSNQTTISAPLVYLTNAGTVSGTGAAISGDMVSLTNRGSIIGDVLANTTSPYNVSTIDNRGGRIVGNVILGAGNDLLLADLNTADPFGQITGTLNAGGGVDTIRYMVSVDTAVSQAPLVPESFEQLGFNLTGNATLTLADTVGISTSISISGDEVLSDTPQQHFINGGTINTVGPAITNSDFSSRRLEIVNKGAVSATLTAPTDWAVRIGRDTAFSNSGTIVATGGGGVTLGSGPAARNDGSIIADQVAVESERQFINSGTVRSLGGAALTLNSASNPASENHGLVEGVDAGVVLYRAGLTNYGTIRASGGPAVLTGGFGSEVLTNAAGGIISADTGPAIGIATAWATSVRVINAGTINGDVILSNPQSGSYPTNNVFVAAAGGVLNGNLNLGNGGDTFVTTLPNDMQHDYAGVSGVVTGGGAETIRYIVEGNRSASIVPTGIFSTVDYELSGNAALTLTAPVTLTSGVKFAGTGAVDMTANIALADAGPALDLTAPSYLMPFNGGLPTANALSVVSRGDITTAQSSAFYNNAAVIIDRNSLFENAGTMTVRNTYPYGSFSAVVGSGTVVNSGTIRLDGALGITGSVFGGNTLKLDIVNSGAIVQAAGGSASFGIMNGTSLVNSGVIDVDSLAVHMLQSYSGTPVSVTNSGLIRSRSSSAVSAARATVVNMATGRIESGAGQPAISIGGTLDNAGVIVGDVELFSHSSFSASYIDRGGMLNGNLTFGDGDDLLILNGDTNGIGGAIDGGAGIDSVVHLYSASRSADMATPQALPLNFEGYGFGAIGPDTVLTIMNSAGNVQSPLTFLGDGTIINQANVESAGDLSGTNAVRLGPPPGMTGINSNIAFINEGMLADGVSGTARSFVNKGRIASLHPVFLAASEVDRFAFDNEGIVTGPAGVALFQQDLFYILDSAEVRNSGEINGNIYIGLNAKDFRFENSGTLQSDASVGGAAGPVRLAIDTLISSPFGPPNPIQTVDTVGTTASVANSGTISNGIMLVSAADNLAVTNSGQINADTQGLAALIEVSKGQITIDGIRHSVDQTNVSFDNSGQIAGKISMDVRAQSVAFTNSGSVSVAAVIDQLPHLSSPAISLGTQTTGDATVSFVNSGSVVQTNAGYRAIDINGGSAGKLSLSVTNTGSIVADGGGVFLHDVVNSDPTLPVYLAPANALSVTSDRTAPGSSVSIVNGQGGRISADGVAIKGSNPNDDVPSGLEDAGSIAVFASADTVHIFNDGTIVGRAGGTIPSTVAIFGLPHMDEAFLAGAIQTENSTDTLINGETGVITGSINLGPKDDRLDNYGRIEGDVHLGSGDDVVKVGTNAAFLGSVNGGDGTDLIELATQSTYAAPTVVDADRFTGFERLVNMSGANAYLGHLLADVDVNGGYLFGRTGSTLSGNVTVASGARFGSAGTVNGDIHVASGGQLAPGASPGTMTVNGDVNLAAGSTSIFELSPTGPSDRLVINGALAIAPGAILNLTGEKALRPGVTYTFLTATSTDGSFGTITQSGAIEGTVQSGANNISITPVLVAPLSSTVQANGITAYINGLLTNGQAAPALIAGLPALLGPDGRANAQAITRLSGEAHASALQLGVEHGLSVVRAGRGISNNAPGAKGTFTFAQGLGAWRTLQADEVEGTARATSQSGGVLSGVGWAGDIGSISAFAGYLDGRQTLAALDARTDLGGALLGVTGRVHSGSFSLAALASYGWGNADTRRSVPNAAITSRYGMQVMTFDVSAGYAIAVGKQWAVLPTIGLSHISAHHDAVQEAGDAGLALAVQNARLNATFIDASVGLRGSSIGGSKISPWIDLGVRRQLNGERGNMIASFSGVQASLTSLGATREQMTATVAVGGNTRLTEQLSLSFSYFREFGGGNGSTVNAGLHYSF